MIVNQIPMTLLLMRAKGFPIATIGIIDWLVAKGVKRLLTGLSQVIGDCVHLIPF